MTPSVFVIMRHDAKRAGLHFDLRFRMPDSIMWASFAVPKGVPTKPGNKVSAFRTKDHTRRDALLTGRIKDGYGTGELKAWDMGKCNILKYTDDRIALEFFGSKVKGIYHLISIAKPGVTENRTHLLFKSKKKTYTKENFPDMSGGGGMGCRVPPADTSETEERDEDDIVHPSLSWSKTAQRDLPWSKKTQKVGKNKKGE